MSGIFRQVDKYCCRRCRGSLPALCLTAGTMVAGCRKAAGGDIYKRQMPHYTRAAKGLALHLRYRRLICNLNNCMQRTIEGVYFSCRRRVLKAVVRKRKAPPCLRAAFNVCDAWSAALIWKSGLVCLSGEQHHSNPENFLV